jgi:DNA-directed RNA polymerase subunit F
MSMSEAERIVTSIPFADTTIVVTADITPTDNNELDVDFVDAYDGETGATVPLTNEEMDEILDRVVDAYNEGFFRFDG